MTIIPRLYCTVCTSAIPEQRATQRATTCTKECKAKLKAFYRAKALERKCRHCNHPSSPEERREFQQWRRDEAKKKKAEAKHATA